MPQIKLYDGFLQARARSERRMREAGLTDAAIHAWLNPRLHGGDFPVEQFAGRLREAGFQESGDPEAPGRHEELLREAVSTSDLGNYLTTKVNTRLLATYNEEPPQWRQYARTFSATDFREMSFTRLGELADLLEMPEGGPPVDQPLRDEGGPVTKLKTFARLLTITRQAIVNDNFNQLAQRPAAMGRAAARSLGKNVVGQLTSNPVMFDGNRVFSSAHRNITTGPPDETTVQQMITMLRVQTDANGNRIGMRPFNMVIPPELEMRTRITLNSTVVPLAGYAPASSRATPLNFGMGGINPLAGAVPNTIVETYSLDPASFWMSANPNQYPGLGVGFLNDRQEPDVFINDPGQRNVLGTSDPYALHTQDITWMVRHDRVSVWVDYRGWVASLN